MDVLKRKTNQETTNIKIQSSGKREKRSAESEIVTRCLNTLEKNDSIKLRRLGTTSLWATQWFPEKKLEDTVKYPCLSLLSWVTRYKCLNI